MKTRRQLFCFLLTIVMLFSLTTPALAGELTTEETLEDYAYAAMKRYIGINGLGRELNMTQPIRISNRSDDAWTVFLFDGVNCVGKMTVARVNGSFTSSFCAGSYDAVEPLVARNMPFALTVKDRSLLLLGENTSATLEGPTVLLSAAETKALLSSAQSQTASLRKVTLTEAEMAAKSTGYMLDVPFVAIGYSPDTGEGICWAAAMASIIRCRTGMYSYLTAVGLYNVLSNTYDSAITNPHANAIWLSRCLDLYNLSYSTYGAGTTYDGVKNIIENQRRPIYAGLRATLSVAHAVVIAGFTSGYGYDYYILVDSNLDEVEDFDTDTPTGIIHVEVTNRSATSFTYPAGDFTYTSWFRRIH